MNMAIILDFLSIVNELLLLNFYEILNCSAYYLPDAKYQIILPHSSFIKNNKNFSFCMCGIF